MSPSGAGLAFVSSSLVTVSPVATVLVMCDVPFFFLAGVFHEAVIHRREIPVQNNRGSAENILLFARFRLPTGAFL